MKDLPVDIVLNVLSHTNDITINNITGSCTEFKNICVAFKDTITKNKYVQNASYYLYDQLPQASLKTICSSIQTTVPPSFNKLSKHFSYYTEDAFDNSILFLNYDVDMKECVVGSIKVRGVIKCISLCCVHQIIQPIDIGSFLELGILRQQDTGFIEVLQPFVTEIPLSSTVDTIFFLQAQGHVDILIEFWHNSDVKKLLTRTPLVMYNKCFESVVPQNIILPINCTWANDYVFIIFNKNVEKEVGLIQLRDRHQNLIYKISAKRLDTRFIGNKVERFAWTKQLSGSMYVVPLSGEGGCFSVIISFVTLLKDLKCSVVRWQERVIDTII
jgi:hypothetical protein